MKNRNIKLSAIGTHGRPIKMRVIEGGETVILREKSLHRVARLSAQRLADIAFNDAATQPNLFVEIRHRHD